MWPSVSNTTSTSHKWHRGPASSSNSSRRRWRSNTIANLSGSLRDDDWKLSVETWNTQTNSSRFGCLKFQNLALILIAEAARQIRQGVRPSSATRTIVVGRRAPASLVGCGSSVQRRPPHVPCTDGSCYLVYPGTSGLGGSSVSMVP